MEEYGKYVDGDCWGYVIQDEEGEDVDSCWGFIGLEYAEEEANRAAEYERDKRERQSALPPALDAHSAQEGRFPWAPCRMVNGQSQRRTTVWHTAPTSTSHSRSSLRVRVLPEEGRAA